MREKLPLPLPQTLSALLFSTVTPEVCECVCGGVGLRNKGMIRSLAEREDFHEGSSTEKDGHLVCCSLSPPAVRPSLPPSCPHVPYFWPAARGWFVGEEREEGGFTVGEKESIARGP